MSNEFITGLIEMNSHMVMEPWAECISVIATIFIIVLGLFMIADVFMEDNKYWKKAWLKYLFVFSIFVALFLIGNKAPKVREIKALVAEPVSLEQIAIQYDIIKIDGKELTLRERK